MSGRFRVLRCVLVGGVVTATRPAVFLAGAQMHPPRADLDALLALVALRILDVFDGADVGTRTGWHWNDLLLEGLVHEGNGNRAFTDRRCHSLDVTCSHIADCENAGLARLEQMWRSRQWPLSRAQFLLRKIGAGLDESALVQRDASVEPARARLGAGHHENVADLVCLFRATVRAPADLLEMTIALEAGDLRARSQLDLRALFDATDQIARHRVGESLGANQHV